MNVDGGFGSRDDAQKNQFSTPTGFIKGRICFQQRCCHSAVLRVSGPVGFDARYTPPPLSRFGDGCHEPVVCPAEKSWTFFPGVAPPTTNWQQRFIFFSLSNAMDKITEMSHKGVSGHRFFDDGEASTAIPSNGPA